MSQQVITINYTEEQVSKIADLLEKIPYKTRLNGQLLPNNGKLINLISKSQESPLKSDSKNEQTINQIQNQTTPTTETQIPAKTNDVSNLDSWLDSLI